MIKFFRQIRKDLVKKNKTGRYFKYAVGEIVLVMIGILLALQVNNWNETRKSSSKEQVILKSLKADFTNNLTLIEQEHKSTENAYYAAIKLKTLINPSAHEFSKQEVDSLISEMYDYIAFDPVSGSINEVINSGQLNIIKNKAIRNETSKWSSIINDAEDDIDITNGFAFNQLIPFLSKKGGISNRLISQTIMKRTKRRLKVRLVTVWMNSLLRNSMFL